VKMFDADKNRMIGLPYGEKSMTICYAVFIWYRNVTDEQTDRQTDLLYQMLRGVWQALNCLSIRATYRVIVAGASPGETKMWAAVRRNGIARPPCISWASCKND